MMESGKRKVESGKWSCRNWTALLFSLSVLLLTASCAKQGYPSGGPKDNKPPKALEAKPANETRHFDRQQFYIEFDEYVVLKDADNNVLVSPPLKHKAEYSTKGKGVQVKIKDTLQENTTYLFQFKGAIVDYTEGNVLQSYEYVFSTGGSMDTMMVAGRVEKARDGKPWKETLTVAAYRATDSLTDTMALAVQPDYVTRSDDSGAFAFHYIPAGSYRLVAFADGDRNLRVGDNESMAFDSRLFAAADSIDSTAMPVLRVSTPDRRQQRVLKADFTALGRITIITLLPMQSPRLDGEKAEWRLNTRRDTMSVWCLNERCDSTVLVLSDSATELRDTLKLRFRRPRRPLNTGAAQPRLQQITPLCDGGKAYYDDLRIAFSVPVTAADSVIAEVMLMKDSSVRHYPVVLDSGGMKARIDASLVSGERYMMRIRDSLFTDIYGHPYDSLRIELTPKDYGILTLHISNATGYDLVVEVLDKRDTVVQQQPFAGAGGTLQFTHLPAAEYRLRAVVDRNGDRQWTPGDYRMQRQPEECIMFDKTLQLREKWEMEEKWKVELKAEN